MSESPEKTPDFMLAGLNLETMNPEAMIIHPAILESVSASGRYHFTLSRIHADVAETMIMAQFWF